MTKRNKGSSTEQGYSGRGWIPPASQEQLTLDHPTDIVSGELDDKSGFESVITDDDKAPDSGVEGFAPLLDPSELDFTKLEPQTPEPEPLPPAPTDAEIIFQLTRERDELARANLEFAEQIPQMLNRAAQLASELSILTESRDGHAVENDRLNFAAQQLTTELASVREQLAVTHLEGSRHHDEAQLLRSNIDAINKSMLFQIYPRRGGQARTYIVAKDLSDAIRKFTESGGKHEDVANVSMVADKLLV